LAEAHPALEQSAPILYGVSATDAGDHVSYPYEGIKFGSVSMRTVLFQPAVLCFPDFRPPVYAVV
jgi:hypothetical protein